MNKIKVAAIASILGLSAAAGSANAFFWGPGYGNSMFDNFFDGFGNMDFHMDGSRSRLWSRIWLWLPALRLLRAMGQPVLLRCAGSLLRLCAGYSRRPAGSSNP